MANGNYSACSAYIAQFQGSFVDHEWDRLWVSKTENMCKFFGGRILQNKIWMLDRITNHGRQTNQICKLCHTHLESAIHMMARCPYSKSVWQGLQEWLGTALEAPPKNGYHRFKISWNNMLRSQAPGAQQRAQKFIYTAWNIWKER
jgi:hypothetical protein